MWLLAWIPYKGTKIVDGVPKPYTGYASAPKDMNLKPAEIIAYRYNNDFKDFGGVSPVAEYYGLDEIGKNTTRGLEQHYYEVDLANNGNDKTKVANKQNPVGEGNGKKNDYRKVADTHLQEKQSGTGGCSKIKK